MDQPGYGVCRLSIAPVYADHHHTADQATQLLFGDHYELVRVTPDRKWGQIRVYSDSSEGWLDMRQHHSISREYFDQINVTEYKITTEVASPVLFRKSPLTIVMGSIVPISSSELFKIEEQFAFNGEAKGLGERRDIDFLRTIAKKYLSAPFQPGGKSPFGIDPCGLVQMVFKITGYSLPRGLKELSNQGKPVQWGGTVPGDIAFFSEKSGGPLSHVGIVFDDERVIHVHGQVRLDNLTEEGILNLETKVFSYWLHSIRRVL